MVINLSIHFIGDKTVSLVTYIVSIAVPMAPPELRCVGEKWQEVASMTSHTSSHFESSPLRLGMAFHNLVHNLALPPEAPRAPPPRQALRSVRRL